MNNGVNNLTSGQVPTTGTTPMPPQIAGQQPIAQVQNPMPQQTYQQPAQPIVQNQIPIANQTVGQNYQTMGPTTVPNQPSGTPPQQLPPQQEPNQVPKNQKNNQKEKKKRNKLAIFLFLIILGLGAYIAFSYQKNQMLFSKMRADCTPVSTTQGEKELDLNSTIVKDLYSKVATNIREDLVTVNLDETMKRYLAYRQIPHKKIYDSNCNLFNNTNMEPYVCAENTTFMPKAFKEDTLNVEIKKLFGEQTTLPKANVQLGKTCIAGYQYIAARGEYVEGYCKEEPTTQYRATKKLIKATSRQSTIILKEAVKYHGADKLSLPEHLRSGTYIYTFKLDTNYNYIYISKELET